MNLFHPLFAFFETFLHLCCLIYSNKGTKREVLRLDDQEKVLAAIRGDDAAFLEIINFHKLSLYKTALAYLRNEEDALEAIQEVTFRAYVNIFKVRKPEFIKTWLIRIMINYCNDAIKNRQKFVREDFIKDIPLHLQFTEHIEIFEALNHLDLRAKELIILKYFHDLKIKDIAVSMNRSEGTIKTWLNRALIALRKLLEEEEVKRDDAERRNKA